MISVAVLITLAAIATIVVTVTGKGNAPRQTAQTAALEGTFAAEYAAATAPNGQAIENAPGGRETWVIESACSTAGCVATGSKVNGSQSTATTWVLDKIGERWTAVSATQGNCQNVTTEVWESMSFQQRSDGTLDGEFIVRSATGCARDQKVTFTRTGDVQPNVSIADPQAQPARVTSSAQGLHGRYQETDTYTDGSRGAEANFDIQSYCLRTGDRCLSYWLNPDDSKTLVFAQNQWVLTTTATEGDCKSGGRAHRQISQQYPLPQPSQDPITLLTGHGHYTITGDCPYNSDFDSRVARTGD